MTKLNKKVRILFFISLGFSIALPIGILGIIFGAVKGMTPMLVIGIVLTVAGFYGTPLLWVAYASYRGNRTIYKMIENEHLYTVAEIAAQTGYPEKDVRARIQGMINDFVLVGYIFKDDTLELNTNEKQEKPPIPTKKCPYCGAETSHNGTEYKCEYCLSSFV